VGIKELLELDENKDLLRLLTAGSVDDGKSTLIGRLLYDSKTVYEDHLKSLARDSKRVGSVGGAIDYALLTDGLKAEREQGITIDVAYRYFSTPRRHFIIADCPGHEQYTRNMATGASTAELAIILVDARQGVLPQTRRHSFIASLLGIGHIIVAINKMDLVDFAEQVFDQIRREYTDFASRLQVKDVQFIPISALEGDNVVESSARTPWYRGGPLLDRLETVHVASNRNFIDLRFPVQYVVRPDASFRGYAGTVASGLLRAGADVVVLPSRRTTKVTSILTHAGAVQEAFPPMAVTATLADDIDVSRGDVIVHANNLPTVADSLEAHLVWMSHTPLSTTRSYLLQHLSSERRAEVTDVLYKFDINDLHRQAADRLDLNEIGRVHIALSAPLAFDSYGHNRATGGFILIDPATNVTAAAGMVLERKTVARAEPSAGARQVTLQRKTSLITPEERARRQGHGAATLWLTGLPAAGKSTIAYALERRLFDAGHLARVLDGENLRLTISANLGFSALERAEHARRAACVAKACNELGALAIVALVSPARDDRQQARKIIGADRFHEVYVSTPLTVCEERDPLGLYARARRGEIERFTGVNAPYEAPETPRVVLPAHEATVEEATERLLAYLREHDLLR